MWNEAAVSKFQELSLRCPGRTEKNDEKLRIIRVPTEF
jgi:hypothetical protein